MVLPVSSSLTSPIGNSSAEVTWAGMASPSTSSAAITVGAGNRRRSRPTLKNRPSNPFERGRTKGFGSPGSGDEPIHRPHSDDNDIQSFTHGRDYVDAYEAKGVKGLGRQRMRKGERRTRRREGHGPFAFVLNLDDEDEIILPLKSFASVDKKVSIFIVKGTVDSVTYTRTCHRYREPTPVTMGKDGMVQLPFSVKLAPVKGDPPPKPTVSKREEQFVSGMLLEKEGEVPPSDGPSPTEQDGGKEQGKN
ncbi:hypothetical protein AXF42_Ash018481 [Apostasia shenzhenica]|uniref:Uncharacterized protein n=1 Tax=Apostasia shenzhenica TaxID=1088818 RepID=A0A2H9ZZF0_9ASPA|nr:hypothetical protein AXF42_Ash018481 [Apostasia shenzhenica]